MLRGFLTALGFLTRVPVPFVKVDDRTLGRALMFFPVVGGAVGVLLAATASAGQSFGSPMVAAFFVVVVWTLLTGALHLDGLADTFDGLAGGRGDKERALEIMRDSRIGTHGAVALVLVLLGKTLVVADLIAKDGGGSLWVVPMAARATVVPAMAWFRYARPEGLGKDMKRNASAEAVAVSQAFMLAGLWFAGTEHWPAVAAAYGATLLTALVLSRKLGGLTGDIYGALIELSELAGLTGLLVALPGAVQILR